jgi:hypothetical protein
MEISFLGNATIRGGINATDMGTLWSIMNHDGTTYSEGKGILTSKATGEMATYTFQAIGGYDPDGKLRNHGSHVLQFEYILKWTTILFERNGRSICR